MENIYVKIKEACQIKETKDIARLVLGEFARLNDGKPLTDDQCESIIRRMRKDSKEMRKILTESGKSFEATAYTSDIAFLEKFLPPEASDDVIMNCIKHVFANNTFKNKMQAMGMVKKMVIDGSGCEPDMAKVKQMILAYEV